MHGPLSLPDMQILGYSNVQVCEWVGGRYIFQYPLYADGFDLLPIWMWENTGAEKKRIPSVSSLLVVVVGGI